MMTHLAWLLHPVSFLLQHCRFGAPDRAAARDATLASAVDSRASRSVAAEDQCDDRWSEAPQNDDQSGSEPTLVEEMVMDLP